MQAHCMSLIEEGKCWHGPEGIADLFMDYGKKTMIMSSEHHEVGVVFKIWGRQAARMGLIKN
eukprot:1138286-Pelagomonas_calceolata.AAC.3